MPIILKFKPISNDINAESQEVKNFVLLIAKLPFFLHQGISTSTRINSQDKIVEIVITIKGLAVIDDESSHMLASRIREKITDAQVPFYLAGQEQHASAGPNEALFLAERFQPLTTKNSKKLYKLKDLEVPEEFTCAISQYIIDEPVFDIRSPHIIYDKEFLKFWLDKSHPKLMPHTNLPYGEHFLKTNYGLKHKIDHFVEGALTSYELVELKGILTKFKVPSSEDKKVELSVLGQALRRCANHGTVGDAIVLLRSGADVNSQDENPEKKFTPLHLALAVGNYDLARALLYSGAKINIKSAKDITALMMILELKNAEERHGLLQTCTALKLISHHSVLERNGLFSAAAAAAASSQQSSPATPALEDETIKKSL